MHQPAVTAALLLLFVPAFAGCSEDVPYIAEDTPWSAAMDVHTDYDKSWGDRYIYARDQPQGTYVAQLTWKEGGVCKQTQHVMALLPPYKTTATICAGLGLDHETAGGGATICISTTTNQPTPVYVFKWTNWAAEELNYRVVDRGKDHDYDASAWLPDTPGNGCLRPG